MTALRTEAPVLPQALPRGVVRGYVPKAPSERISSGHDRLDVLLAGGFPRAGLSEIFGPPSSGRTSLVYALLRSVTTRGEAVALVDHSDRFDPPHAERAGIRLSQILWIRPRESKETFRCGEILLGTRGFALVIIDLADEFSSTLARFDSAWARLAHRAASNRTAVVLLSEKRLSGSFAHVCVSLADPRPIWAKRRLGVPLFVGFRSRAEIVRARDVPPGRARWLCFDGQNADAPAASAERRSR